MVIFFSEVAAAVSIFCFAAEPLDTFRVGGNVFSGQRSMMGDALKQEFKPNKKYQACRKCCLNSVFDSVLLRLSLLGVLTTAPLSCKQKYI